jgi:hypothetical protein
MRPAFDYPHILELQCTQDCGANQFILFYFLNFFFEYRGALE